MCTPAWCTSRTSTPRTIGGVPARLVIRDLALADGTSAQLQLGIAVGVDDGAGLLQAAMSQLDGGADFVKIMLDAPAGDQTAPFSTDEVSHVVQAVHARGKKITAHATIADGARVAAGAGVDSIEHGFAIDADIARTMAANDVTLVSTLSVLASVE